MKIVDPLAFAAAFWPHVTFYDKQREIIYSVVSDDETVVPAGNMLGKDFVAGFIALYFFMTRHPCRIVTTSAKEKHLNVLWGELNRFILTARHRVANGAVINPLTHPLGDHLICNQFDIRKIIGGSKCPISYIMGLVANADTIESFQGHHTDDSDGIKRGLFIGDEASTLSDDVFSMVKTWAKRKLLIGNTWDCSNYFYRSVKGDPAINDPGGDMKREYAEGFHRRVIHITAEDSPNIKLARKQIAKGRIPDDERLIPGVKSWSQYQLDLKLMDPIEQSVSLLAQFYEGAQVKLIPQEWLQHAHDLALELQSQGRILSKDPLTGKQVFRKRSTGKRKAKAIGVDTAEGGDMTVWCAVDEDGILDIISEKTPDTSKIPGKTIAFMKEWACKPEDVLFDRGGGGYQHVQQLHRMGFPVRCVMFGEQATMVDKYIRYFHTRKEKRVDVEVRTIYKNRRAEMYGTLREILNPANETGFTIHPKYDIALPGRRSLCGQLKVIPLWRTDEGILYLPPKHLNPDQKENPDKTTLVKMIGHSPDEADALVLAVFGMTHKPTRNVIRGISA
jgi:hypothetical protein